MSGEALVVSTGPVPDEVQALLAGVARVVVTDGSSDALLARAADVAGFIVRSEGHLPASLIEAAPRLRVIGRSGVGGGQRGRGRRHASWHPGRSSRPMPAPSLSQRAPSPCFWRWPSDSRELDALVRAGRFAERERAVVAEFAGATLGVVGMGRIGRRVAALGTAFGMSVLAADPVLGDERLRELGTEPVTLPELFDRADHIALHAPLVPETRGMITADLLMSAGPGAFLVNLARGGLIESLDAVAAALDAGALAGVGLDVFEPEPPDLSHRLFSDPRVLLSPHALGLSDKSRERIFGDMARGVRAVLEGRRPAAVANPEVYRRSAGP